MTEIHDTGLYREVLRSRTKAHAKHRDTKGGSMEQMDADRPSWLAILVEEVGEVARALTYDGTSNLRDELVDVIAVASAWVDRIDVGACRSWSGDRACVLPFGHSGDWHDDGKAAWLVQP